MTPLNLEDFRSTPLVREPFQYLVVPGFIRSDALPDIHADYPQIESPGSFPVEELSYGPRFRALLDELRSQPFRHACEEKFQIDLTGRPTMLTVRGRCGTRDGNIHTDATNKLITVLVYMNPRWEESGGRLRILRSAHDLDDFLVEVPPVEGTLVVFRRSDNSYHGHKPFVGPRRVIQLNWVTDRRFERSEIWRHRVSAWTKKVLNMARRPRSEERRLRSLPTHG